jgi:carboxymethylenebutenolidase
VQLSVDGEPVETTIWRPRGDAAPSGVVLATEAQGVNRFINQVGADLADQGFVVAIPDYYRGRGPADPEALVDLASVETIQHYIDALDFRRGTEDVLAAIGYLRDVEGATDVAVWGYCTGATLAMMAACVGRTADAAVLFYPSQPTFPELSATRPQDPVDLIWQLRCPVQLLVGADDPVWPTDMVDDVVRRFEQWLVPYDLRVYDGCGHVFAGHFADWHRPDAAAASWSHAIGFLRRHLRHDGLRTG